MALPESFNDREKNKFEQPKTETSALIPKDRAAVRVTRDVGILDTLHVFTEVVTPILTFRGRTVDSFVGTDQPIWQLERTSLVGNETHLQFANNGVFDQIWDDRNAPGVFPPIPFSDVFSAVMNGVDEFIDMDNPTGTINFTETDTFSLSIWTKTSFNSSPQAFFSKKVQGGTAQGYEFFIQASTGFPQVLLVNTGTGSKLISVHVATNVTDGNWHNVILTYDGSSSAAGVQIFVDSVLGTNVVATDNLTGDFANAAKPLLIGSRDNAFLFMNGNLNEPSAWDKVLTQAEVNELYNSGLATDLAVHSATADLISWWRMGEERTGSTIPDQIGSNNGTTILMDDSNFVQDVPS